MSKYLKHIYPYDWLVLVYLIFSLILSAFFGMRIDYESIFQYETDITLLKLIVIFLFIYISIFALQYRRKGEDDFIFGEHWRKYIKDKYLNWRNIFDLIRVLILLKLALLIYCNIKQAIPFMNTFLYDEEFLLLDRIIHFGINPNKLSVELMGGDFICGIMDRIYIFWYLVNILVVLFFAILPDRKIHIRFFTSYFALWIFGGLFALLLPCLGPIYAFPSWFENINKPFASGLQRKLILNYDSALANPDAYKVFVYEGVAAFPSLHVGVVALFTFFIYKINKTFGWIMCSYTIFIQLGSVLLGWHYAIDGYFSILLAWFLFKGSEFLVGKDRG